MRKIILSAIIILFIGAFFINSSNEKEIRVRVIPNSDSLIDKELKKNVKEITIGFLASLERRNYNSTIEEINNNIDKLEYVLRDYNAKVSFDYHTLYNKTYNDNAIKDEEAYTLYIVLGEGKGSNWWGTIYPEFLGISSEEEIKYKSFFYELFTKGEIKWVFL